ncbi:Cilia- and flagella-associated protein 91 [Thoreauomyces humboldtii]|nr:Cilia- and flagella-associated protein 91 [Thoreauomyces humboldtii]
MSSIVHARVIPNRAHDYLYDANHTVAGPRDHARNMAKAQTHDVLIQPSYGNMFSTLPHHRSTTYAIRAHQLPLSLGHDRRTYVSTSNDVTGASRFKYFRRPIIPYMPSLGTQIVYARRPMLMTAEGSMTAEEEAAAANALTPPTRTVGIQTLYRESDTQTDPYSPEYILHPSCNSQAPELLSLLTLTFAQGLPVTTTELELIERARAKRAWEATLPVVTDNASFERRLRMMEEMELCEWRMRETEIKRLQSARLKILRRVIEEREEQNSVLAEARVRKVWDRKMLDRDALLEKLQRRKVKAVRKLADQRRNVEPKIERRDIIAEYADYGSGVYAPRTRDGVFLDKSNVGIKVKIGEGVDGYNALEALSHDILPNLLPSAHEPPTLKKSSSSTARRDAQLYAQLELMDAKLKERQSHPTLTGRDEGNQKPLRFAQRIEKPPVRPPTPLIVDPHPDDDAREVSAILLQKLIRGRVAQNMMYQGKQRRQHLISELRTRQSFPSSSRATNFPPVAGSSAYQGMAKGDRLAAAAAAGDAAAALALENGGGIEDAVDGSIRKGVQVVLGHESPIPEGSEPYSPSQTPWSTPLLPTYVSRTLHHLTSDLLRLREEHRISALVKLAERTRRMREAQESGTRQAELARRVVEDEVFRQVMGVHRESVQTFLEDVVAGVGERVAGREARRRVGEYVETVVRVTDIVDGSREAGKADRPSSADRGIVADLVSSFLIPEVERQTLRNQGKDAPQTRSAGL